jgi:hypothetical protein
MTAMNMLKKFDETFPLAITSEGVQLVINMLRGVPALLIAVATMMTTMVEIHVEAAKTGEVSCQILVDLTSVRLTLCTGGGRKYDDYSSSESESPPRRKNQRRKSLGESALAALGLGELAGAGASAAGGRGSRSKSRGGRRRRARSYSSSRSRSRTPERGAKIQQAVQAALTAGAVEAFRSRKEPGPWTGEKGKRVLTAAIGAGAVDGVIDHDPNKSGTRHTVEAVIGGLAGNRIANGPRSGSRSRGGGGGGGGLKDLAAGGLAAAAGKAFLDNRSRSKSRGRRQSYDSDSDDSRSPPRRRPQYRSRRSKSLVGYVDKGLAALGLTDSKRDRDDDRDRQGSRRSGGYDDGYSQPRNMPREDVARMRGGGGERKGGSSSYSSSDEDMDSSEEAKKQRKMKGKEFLTAGLATVATIHAGHEIYQSFEKAQKHHKEVRQGTLSAQEARKLKSKALLQDAASVGIAALGIKGAMSEWKEMKESRDECHEFIKKREEKKKHRGQKGSSKNGRPGYGGSQPSYRNSAPNLYAGYQNGGRNGYGGGGPMYQDGNPYAAGALPPPPMGAPPARY